MGKIIKFESHKERRIREIREEMEAVGEAETAKIAQQCLQQQNGKEVPYILRSQATDEWIQAMGRLIPLRRELDHLLGNE